MKFTPENTSTMILVPDRNDEDAVELERLENVLAKVFKNEASFVRSRMKDHVALRDMYDAVGAIRVYEHIVAINPKRQRNAAQNEALRATARFIRRFKPHWVDPL